MKPLMIGISLILMLIIGSFVLTFVNPTGMATKIYSPAVNLVTQNICQDSDGGIDILKYGTTKGVYLGQRVTKTDTCVGTDKVNEWFCQIPKSRTTSPILNISNITKSCNDLGDGYSCKGGRCQKEEIQTKILEIPLLKNSYCFWIQNANLPECSSFYKDECFYEGCIKSYACPKYYNPVYDNLGIFYPSACWAEQLGVSNYKYGYSERMMQFMKDLWYTPKNEYVEYYNVSKPIIEFSYSGAGLDGLKSGVFLRSVIWLNQTNPVQMDFNINTNQGKQISTSFSSLKRSHPVTGNRSALMIFMPFDDVYPESILFNLTKAYIPAMNDYFKKKELVSNPAQFNITPVKISLPEGIVKPTTGTYDLSQDIEKIYSAGLTKAPGNYDILIIIPIFLNGYGGNQYSWNSLQVIEAPLSLHAPYSTNVKEGLDALASFQFMFQTISHELLHTLGLASDHFPMGYGTHFLDTPGLNVDQITGKYKISTTTECDFFSASPDYYAIKLPLELKIKVGQEPTFLMKTESVSGPCLSGIYQNAYLKDFNNDSEYEIMYSNNIIGVELQRTLGWTDVDLDGKIEIVDPDPYGGIKELILPEKPDGKVGGQKGLTFQVLGQESFENCTFKKVRLEDGQEGLIPIKCAEFVTFNLYPELKYNYEKVQKNYGTIFLPRLS